MPFPYLLTHKLTSLTFVCHVPTAGLRDPSGLLRNSARRPVAAHVAFSVGSCLTYCLPT
jgi:hypothetical protein